MAVKIYFQLVDAIIMSKEETSPGRSTYLSFFLHVHIYPVNVGSGPM